MATYEVRITSAWQSSGRRVGDVVMTCATEPEAVYFVDHAHCMISLRGCTLEVLRVEEPPPEAWAASKAS